MAAKRVNIVVAVCNNQGIGIEGRIPWRLKKDMAMFKRITSTTTDDNKQKINAVIMGRKTWLSIPDTFRPLPNRLNIVLSTTMKELSPGIHLARSFQDAMDLVNKGDVADRVESVFIIGGSSVYKEAMDWPDCRIYLTRVLSDFRCDSFMPDISTNIFKKTENPEWLPRAVQEEGTLRFVYEMYDKF